MSRVSDGSRSSTSIGYDDSYFSSYPSCGIALAERLVHTVVHFPLHTVLLGPCCLSLLVLNICVFTQDQSSATQENVTPTCRPTDPPSLGQPSTFIRPPTMTPATQHRFNCYVFTFRVATSYHCASIWCSPSHTDCSVPIPIYHLPAPYSAGTNSGVAPHATTSIENFHVHDKSFKFNPPCLAH